jgi:hypothetical protein
VTTPNREQREHDLGPAPGQRPVQRVARLQVAPFGEQDQGREGDAEADQRNVNGQRERLYLARLEQVGLIDGGRGDGTRSVGEQQGHHVPIQRL